MNYSEKNSCISTENARPNFQHLRAHLAVLVAEILSNSDLRPAFSTAFVRLQILGNHIQGKNALAMMFWACFRDYPRRLGHAEHVVETGCRGISRQTARDQVGDVNRPAKRRCDCTNHRLRINQERENEIGGEIEGRQ